MTVITEWCENIMSRPSLTLTRAVRVEGIRKEHVGGTIQFAVVEVLAESSATLEVGIATELKPFAHAENYMRAAVFGILDVLLTSGVYPLRNVRITIIGYEQDPIDSSQMAFHFAGRDAGNKILEAMTSVKATSNRGA